MSLESWRDIGEANVRRWSDLAESVTCTFPIERVDFSNVSLSAKILDYGCGSGRMLERLATLGYRDLVGWDPAVGMARVAKSVCPSATVFGGGDPRKPPFQPHEFDAVVLTAVLSSVVPTVERESLLVGVARLMAHDGRLLVGDFGYSDRPPYPTRYGATSSGEERTFRTSEGICIHHFTRQELVGLVRRVGLQVELQKTASTSTLHGRRLPAHFVTARRIPGDT